MLGAPAGDLQRTPDDMACWGLCRTRKTLSCAEEAPLFKKPDTNHHSETICPSMNLIKIIYYIELIEHEYFADSKTFIFFYLSLIIYRNNVDHQFFNRRFSRTSEYRILIKYVHYYC